MPAMNQAAAISAPTSMWMKRMPNDGLEITCSQSTGSNCPLTRLKPAGVCIHEFATRIQVTDRIVPRLTMQVEKSIIRLPIRPSP
jgi:hypothetical protein